MHLIVRLRPRVAMPTLSQMIGSRGRGLVDNGAVSDKILYLSSQENKLNKKTVKARGFYAMKNLALLQYFKYTKTIISTNCFIFYTLKRASISVRQIVTSDYVDIFYAAMQISYPASYSKEISPSQNYLQHH